MSDLESLRRRIAEEEAKLARIDKDREETLSLNELIRLPQFVGDATLIRQPERKGEP